MAGPRKKRPFSSSPPFLSSNNLRRLELSAMGLYLLVALALGVAIGYYLDRWLGTAPWFLVIFILAGLFAGFRNMYRLLRREIDLSRKGGEE